MRIKKIMHSLQQILLILLGTSIPIMVEIACLSIGDVLEWNMYLKGTLGMSLFLLSCMYTIWRLLEAQEDLNADYYCLYAGIDPTST